MPLFPWGLLSRLHTWAVSPGSLCFRCMLFFFMYKHCTNVFTFTALKKIIMISKFVVGTYI